MTQINANAAASILGIKVPQVQTLIRRGVLRRLNEGKHNRFIQVDYDQVLRLKEKYPNPNDLLAVNAMRNGAGSRMTGATNAAIMERLNRIEHAIHAIANALQIAIERGN